MATVPVTRYAKSGSTHVAYQVLGDGPLDLVFVPGWISHLEMGWEFPLLARFLRRLASFSRLVLFDKRGTGMSDHVPVSELPTLEQRMDDVRAVMDAVGSERAALLGLSEGGPMNLLFAATYPERTRALILVSSYARIRWATDYPIGTREETFGIQIRAGLHTGECDVVGQKLSGIAVHVGARVCGFAAPGQVLVSSTVRDLVAGSGIGFEDVGPHALKGIPGEWRLFAVGTDTTG